MTIATREYLIEVVRQFEICKGRRNHLGLKRWEQKLLDGAQKLLREEQWDFGTKPAAEAKAKEGL